MTDIGALLEELDGLRKLVADEWERDEAKAVYQVEPWHGDCDHYGDLVADFATKEAADAAVALHHAYPELRAYIRKAEKVIAAARADHIDANMMCVYHRPETRCKGCPNGVTPSGKRDHDGCPGEDWWERNMDSYERAFCDALADLDEGDTE